MTKSITVKAAHGKHAIAVAARKLGLPKTAKYKKLEHVSKGRWRVTFE